MAVDGPGTIVLHPKGGNAVGGGRRLLFWFAMQSRRRRKKAGDGRCGNKIEAALALPVFGQTSLIEVAVVRPESVKKITTRLQSIERFRLHRKRLYRVHCGKRPNIDVKGMRFPSPFASRWRTAPFLRPASL